MTQPFIVTLGSGRRVIVGVGWCVNETADGGAALLHAGENQLLETFDEIAEACHAAPAVDPEVIAGREPHGLSPWPPIKAGDNVKVLRPLHSANGVGVVDHVRTDGVAIVHIHGERASSFHHVDDLVRLDRDQSERSP